ncbi:hypothetical protein [Streptomyces sp. S.PB5]|uniref:hypothetical protein n=1 Tax=Streptomyces sp. S.PB5 TaxID=3020844 RepID=UPI0025B106C8|nr:hypothetical protein [Streptomyces sp. S.PB5]MDN3020516.1 hypothetical protein [Streptomyces sp. S.PB5]
MITLVLLGVLALAVFGCVCVVWAERGGPRWVRVVAAVTVGLGKLLDSSRKRARSSSGNNSSDE